MARNSGLCCSPFACVDGNRFVRSPRFFQKQRDFGGVWRSAVVKLQHVCLLRIGLIFDHVRSLVCVTGRHLPALISLLDRPCQSGARGEHSGNTGCAIEAGAVTVRPRSPAASNAFRTGRHSAPSGYSAASTARPCVSFGFNTQASSQLNTLKDFTNLPTPSVCAQSMPSSIISSSLKCFFSSS